MEGILGQLEESSEHRAGFGMVLKHTRRPVGGWKEVVMFTNVCCGWEDADFLGYTWALLGGDGGNLGLGSEEGRPHHRSAAFASWPTGLPQSSFLKQISCLLFVQLHVEYNCVLFFGQSLLTTAFSQVLFRLAAYLFTLEFLCVWSSPPSVPTSAGLALPLPGHRTAALTVLFLGGVHLAMASVYLGNIAALLEVSPMLACP